MTAEIICVGTDILSGCIVNTNASYLAQQLAGLGISCYYQTAVDSNKERLSELIKTAAKRSDILILSGGMGSTEDDITKECVTKFCGKKIIETSPNCIVYENHNGTTSGMLAETDNCKIVMLPGAPGELAPMFEEYVVPYLKEISPCAILTQTVKICGVEESQVEIILHDLITKQENPQIATYAKTGEVHVRVTAKADNKKDASKLIKPLVKEIKNRLGNNIYTADDGVTLEKSLVDLLTSAGLTITCAESCTGGLLSATLINVPGISELYKAGLITYSNKAKRRLLGVKKSSLQKYTAVSSQVAEEMVKGLLADSKTDVGIAVTGYAGPDTGDKERPTGLVYISCSVKGKVTVQEYHFTGNREKIRQSAVSAALMLARSCVLEYLSKVTFGK